MTNEANSEPITLDHRGWSRDGAHELTLLHRPGRPNNAWMVRHHLAYKGGGGFGYDHSFNHESEARSHFARMAVVEDAKHAEWLAKEAAKGA